MATTPTDPRNKGHGYARKYLKLTKLGTIDEFSTREAIRDYHNFENAHHAPPGDFTEFMARAVFMDKETFLSSMRSYDDKWAAAGYKKILAGLDVDCAETFVHEHKFGYAQHMEDNYFGISEAKALSLLVFEGGYEWENLLAFKEFGLHFLNQAVATCEDNEDTENQRDKHAILTYARARRAEESAKRAKYE